jgi:hypothetical protein
MLEESWMYVMAILVYDHYPKKQMTNFLPGIACKENPTMFCQDIPKFPSIKQTSISRGYSNHIRFVQCSTTNRWMMDIIHDQDSGDDFHDDLGKPGLESIL